MSLGDFDWCTDRCVGIEDLGHAGWQADLAMEVAITGHITLMHGKLWDKKYKEAGTHIHSFLLSLKANKKPASEGFRAGP